MSNNEFSQLMNDVLFGIRHCLFKDELGLAMMRVFENGVCDDRIAGMISHRVQREKRRQAFCQIPFDRPKLRQGKLMLGYDMDRNPVLIPIQYLNAHCLMIANTGSGKTTKSRFLIIQIVPHVKGLWAVDLRKREFRVLRPYLKRLGINLIIVPGRSFRINPLQVPLGVDPASWAASVASILIQVLSLPPRASKLVQTTIFHLYQKFGILAGRDLYPTLFDLFETIRQNKAANAQSRPAILDSLDPVLSSLGPKALAYRRGWSTSDLASMHLVFEFAGLADTDSNLLLTSTIFSEFSSRIGRGVSNPQMDLWICCDEANRICSASHESTSRISDIVGLVRGSGIGLDFSVLSTDGLASQISSNCVSKIMGRCGSAADYASAGHSMGLSTEQIAWCKLNLRPGMFVGQLGEGNWRYPFVFTIPEMKFPANSAKKSSDLDLGPIESLPTVFAEEFRNWGQAIEVYAGGDNTCQTENASALPTTVLNPAEYRFLVVVAQSPMLSCSSYAKPSQIGQKTAKQLRLKLVEAGYLREHTVAAKGRGRNSILLEITSAGKETVANYKSQEANHV